MTIQLTPPVTEEVREYQRRDARARRSAFRQGLRLVKSRRRNPNATDYGTYMIIDLFANYFIANGMDLKDVEEYLSRLDAS